MLFASSLLRYVGQWSSLELRTQIAPAKCATCVRAPQDFGDIEAMAKWMGVGIHVSVCESVPLDLCDYRVPRNFIVGNGDILCHVRFDWIAGADGHRVQSTVCTLLCSCLVCGSSLD